jgi:signal transduction histidine kinase
VAQAFNTMAEAVEQSMSGLRDANAELQKADRYKDEFLFMVSHELRTPLHFVMGFASLLSNSFAGPLTEEQRGYVANINTGADRMLTMVNELLDSAALRAGKLRLELERTVYPPLVENVLATLKPLADEKQLALALEVRSAVPLRLDREHITRVLTNLVANAIKFTPAQGRIEVRVELEGEALVTEVHDTGVGIPAEFLPSLFQPFTQLDMSSTRRTGGTGLGLSICKALVEAHGGSIEVESLPQQGSTFRFRLPTGAGAIAQAAAG